jgi:hypothetical protein
MELENENQCGGCSPEISHFWVEDWAALIEENTDNPNSMEASSDFERGYPMNG